MKNREARESGEREFNKREIKRIDCVGIQERRERGMENESFVPSKRIRGLGENFKVGDRVHLGHGTKGGSGVVGKVVKVAGNDLHIENEKGDTFKGG